MLAALPGLETPNLTGGMAKVLPNHHITKPVYIGEVRADGQFNVVWKTAGTVPGDAWSDFLPGSKDIEADWVTLKCGNYNTRPRSARDRTTSDEAACSSGVAAQLGSPSCCSLAGCRAVPALPG